MAKESSTWFSDRLDRDINLVRWGEIGTPVLIFPTADGDAEECERFLMIDALAPLLEAGRIKLYSVDSIAGDAWLKRGNTSRDAARLQNAFDNAIYNEVVPAIRTDCKDPNVEIIVTGASIGAFNALAAICRHPDVFSKAICMSGTFDMAKFIEGEVTGDYFFSSPLHFLPKLDEHGDHLRGLRQRSILLAHGDGRWEEPAQSWRTADALGARGIPNRVDAWGEEYDHDWPTWRRMLPKYLEEALDAAEKKRVEANAASVEVKGSNGSKHASEADSASTPKASAPVKKEPEAALPKPQPSTLPKGGGRRGKHAGAPKAQDAFGAGLTNPPAVDELKGGKSRGTQKRR